MFAGAPDRLICMLLLSDQAVAAVTAVDNGDPLVDVRGVSDFEVDERKQDLAGDWSMLRRSVVDRLVEAQASLPLGIRFLVIEGYRRPSLQERYFAEHLDSVNQEEPDWPAERAYAEASKHVSPVSVAPHPCGAAVDLTLSIEGVELDLGTPVNATPRQSEGACFTEASNISAEAREWRQVLRRSLEGVGLVNYPPEWWHWSFGDRYWAVVTGAPHAVYAPL
jgi:D-alanyl-D-alanine dipeptidase